MIVEHDDKRQRELADQTAKLDAKKADSLKSLKVKNKEKSTKRTLQWEQAAAERKKYAVMSFDTVDSKSSDDIDDEIDLETRTVGSLSKSRRLRVD
jgi:hypothetical protein